MDNLETAEQLAELLETASPQLLRIARFRIDPRLVRRISPEDIIQDVFIAAKKRLHHYDNNRHTPFLWLRLILMQTLCDTHREHLGVQARDIRKEAGAVGFDPGATSATIAYQISGGGHSPSVSAVRRERAQHIQKLLEQLSPIDQEIVALRHYEELSNKEVATILGIEIKAASIRYVRALRRLKEIVSSAGYFESEMDNG